SPPWFSMSSRTIGAILSFAHSNTGAVGGRTPSSEYGTGIGSLLMEGPDAEIRAVGDAAAVGHRAPGKQTNSGDLLSAMLRLVCGSIVAAGGSLSTNELGLCTTIR